MKHLSAPMKRFRQKKRKILLRSACASDASDVAMVNDRFNGSLTGAERRPGAIWLRIKSQGRRNGRWRHMMLSNLNSIIIEGNLVRDPMLKATPNGHPVCSFAVASNRFYKQNEDTEKEVSFFDIETWSKLAQTCGDVLKKGRGVRVVGRLKQDRWTDNGGKNQSRIKIVAEHVEFKPVFRKETDPQAITEAAENESEVYAEEREPEVAAVF